MKNLINKIILFTQLLLITFGCVKYKPGIITLVNLSDKSYYFNIIVSDSISDEITEIDFDKNNPPFSEIKPNEEKK